MREVSKKSLGFFILLFLMTLCVQAQSDLYDNGILVLRNGDSLTGMVKLSHKTNKILFKNQGSKKKLKFDSKKVKRVVMMGYDTNAYSYKIAGSGKPPILLQEIIITPRFSLLKDTRTYVKYVRKPTSFDGSNGQLEKRLAPVWYISTNNADRVENISTKRPALLKRFNDCPDVIKKYRDYDDDTFYVIEFMRLYIEKCAN